ncbi:MAG: 5'-nucleotidase C-terminal domain-containing protein [Coriobacteriales bacterium]|nr:5'-nucleotidase C-terminal domain-containing protein [Coriobacteriales bacterium]
MLTRRQALKLSAALGGAGCAALVGCTNQDSARSQAKGADSSTRQIRLLATSDLHGKFLPWDYTTNKESTSGSVAQLATAVRELRDENTILIDAGDSIQGNMAQLFKDDSLHPMIACLNELKYDIGVTGNHEYDYGMDVLRNTVSSFEGTMLCGNVWDEHGDPIAAGYTIMDKGGVRVGLIGMVTPNITHWSAQFLKDCKVTNPLTETRAIIDKIKDEVDVLVGVMHMGLENQYDTPGSGVTDLANACPEFDVIVAAHMHTLVEDKQINGVLVVENEHQGKTMVDIVLDLERKGDGWAVAKRTVTAVHAADLKPHADIVSLMQPFDERAKAYTLEVIGVLKGAPISANSGIEGLPLTVLEDTAAIDIAQQVQLHYSKAAVSLSGPSTKEIELQPGDLRRCDLSQLYYYANTLYTVEMTGAQLKSYLEHAAAYYRQYRDGDLTLAFEPKTPVFNMCFCQGLNYRIDVSREAGFRICDLTWPDGTPVAGDEKLIVATDNYAANEMMVPGAVLDSELGSPVIKEVDVCGNIGGILELLEDYIVNVLGGVLEPQCDRNWEIVGNDWDLSLHQQAMDALAAGKLSIADATNEGRILTSEVITEEDLKGIAGA